MLLLEMFPARAGMSRSAVRLNISVPYVPRASGDEPDRHRSCTVAVAMFPARAGMSLPAGARRHPARYVPRASGDEPNWVTRPAPSLTCSPRERG